ncbi:MAG: cobalamin biosynthesis protein [Parasporobacterium sp.]|nr:cobalamin biosynthesis protein [Parasporobacterium sp.]
MKIAIIAFSRQGIRTAQKAAGCFAASQVRCFTIRRFVQEFPEFAGIPDPAGEFYREQFEWADLMIFVCALGITVRKIAPWVKDKRTDPAVVSMDERGEFAIAVLSGHIGGANRYAQQIAEKLGGKAVITTATDINHRFSVDAWAVSRGMHIDDMKIAKEISAAILERDLPIRCDLPVDSGYPQGTIPCSLTRPEAGILISWKVEEPFSPTLRLIPKVVHLGIGCRKGVSADRIEQSVSKVLAEHAIDPRAVKGVWTIDLKAEEEGLKELCRTRNWPLRVCSAEELKQVPGDFSASEFVQSVTGVDNVCERAALIDADRLIVRKTAADQVTVAAAVRLDPVSFDPDPGFREKI